MEQIFRCSLVVLVINFSLSSWTGPDDLIGHMRRIGEQNPVIRGQIKEVNTMMSGKKFYTEFFLPSKPVVFRGALLHTKAFKNWPEDEYMNMNYGNVRGLVDHRKTWDRGGRELPPRSFMTYREFLSRFVTEDLYWDEAMPYKHDILKDMPVPLALNCEETRSTFLYINFMVNSGNVSYVLHSDFADNFFHFIAGEKTWLIANSSYREAAYIGKATQSLDLSPVVPDAVDLIKYPRMSEIEFHEVKLKAGDILYVPRNWLHYVRSYGTPNIGMNIWFGGSEAASSLPEKPECKRQLKTASLLFEGAEG